MVHAGQASSRDETRVPRPGSTRTRITTVRRGVFLTALLTLWAVGASAAPRLTEVEVIDTFHVTAIELYLDQPVLRVSAFEREGPRRLVMRLSGVVDASGGPVIEVGSLRAARVRVEPRGADLDIVVEAGNAEDPFRGHGFSFTDTGVLLIVGLGLPIARGDIQPEPAPAVEERVVGAEEAPAVVEVPTLAEPDAGLPAAPQLTDVEVTEVLHATTIQLFLDQPVSRVSAVEREDPRRLVVRLSGVVDASGEPVIEVGSLRAARVRVEPRGADLEIVIEAGNAVDPFRGHGFSLIDTGILVTVGLGLPVAREGIQPEPAVVEVPTLAEPDAGLPAVAPGGLPQPARADGLQVGAAPQLTYVEVIDAHHATAIELFVDQPVSRVRTVVREGPRRLVVRLPGVVDASGEPVIEVGSPRAARVRVEPRGADLEIVVEAGNAVDPFRGHGFSRTETGVLVTVGVGLSVAREGTQLEPALSIAARVAGGEKAPAPRARPVPTVAEPEALVPAVPAGDLPQPVRADGLAYTVDAFELAYAREHREHTPVEALMNLEVQLGRVEEGFTAPREGVPTVRMRLADVPRAAPHVFYGSAIRTIDERIVGDFVGRGLAGVLVLPDEAEIDPRSSRDLRPPERTALRIVIWTGQLLEYRTFASGDRIPEGARVDSPAHERIKKHSPNQPGDLLDRQAIDAYAQRLGRHPGRNVSTALSAAGEPGGVYLDYLVAENKPITAYFQASNTGTKGTTDWRQRFGFAHNQLTGRDDILRFDYITGSFDKVNAVFSSYDFPLIGIDRLRGNVGGSWSEYDSSQFGFVLSRFTGDQWDVSGELEANIFQYGDFFADLFAGIRYQGVNVNNQIVPGFDIKADSQYFFPTVGLRFERQTDTSQLNGALLNDWNAPGVTGVSSADMALMGGAANPALYDTSFAILRWETYASTYLEPILNPAGYHDPSTHWSSTQAHEVYLGFRGQYAYNDHLIPQHQMVAGGYHTVRGYPQSSVAGDNVYVGRAEYRLHVPRLFSIQPVPKQVPVIGAFRVARDQPYGRPDWDFVIRAFFDAARVTVNNKQPGQTDDTLLSPGVGAELRFKDNLAFNVDWGYALKSVRNGLVKKGHDEVWFVITMIY